MPYELSRRIEALRPYLPAEHHSRAARYGVGALCAAGTVAARAALESFLGPYSPFLLFLPGVIVASRYGGLAPGVFCTALCGAASVWMHRHLDAQYFASLGTFLALGAFISALNESLRRASVVLGDALEKTQEIMESISDGFYALDRRWRFIYVNRAALKAWGKTREELLGRSIWDVFPETVGGEVHEAHLEAARDRRPRRLESVSRVLGKWMDVSIHPSSEGLAVYFHDITERRKRREELESLVERRTSRLREVNEELETFTYSASHDLRAPARKVRGYADLLRRRHEGALPREALSFLDRIRDSTGAMMRVIDEMRVLAEASQRELRPETVDLSAVAARFCEQRRSAEPGRRVACAIEPGLSARGDRALLELAVSQLLDNAFKFTRRRRHPRVEFGAAPGPRGRVFYVKDDGVGFDMTHARKLFKPFERLHDTGEYEGAGVGLAIVQRVVRRHGGEVWADSKPGGGAAVYFTLPEAP